MFEILDRVFGRVWGMMGFNEWLFMGFFMLLVWGFRVYILNIFDYESYCKFFRYIVIDIM